MVTVLLNIRQLVTMVTAVLYIRQLATMVTAVLDIRELVTMVTAVLDIRELVTMFTAVLREGNLPQLTSWLHLRAPLLLNRRLYVNMGGGEIGVACYCMLTWGEDRTGLLLYVNMGEIGVACYCMLTWG